MFDVLPFEINNENYFLYIGIVCTIFDNFPRSSVGCRVDYQSVGREFESPVLLFISFVEFYKWIFGANVIDFEIFKTMVVIIF